MGCVAAYQAREIFVRTEYALGTISPQAADLTYLVKDVITSSTPATFTVENVGASVYIQPHQSGTANVYLDFSDQNAIAITIGSDSTSVTDLSVSFFTSLMSTPSSYPTGASGVNYGQVLLITDFSTPETLATVVVTAIFLDGSSMDLRAEHGLILESLNTDIIEVIDVQSIRIKGPGSGRYLRAIWKSPCVTDNVTVYEKDIFIQIEFEVPVSIRIEPDYTTLMSSSDRANQIGRTLYPNNTSYSVILTYSDARTLDITQLTDIYTITATPLGNSLNFDQGLLSVTGNATGIIDINISYDQYSQLNTPLTHSINIEVVKSTGIALNFRPYPEFTGSQSISLSTLKVYSFAFQFQKSLLETSLQISNGDTHIITETATIEFSNNSIASISDNILQPIVTGRLVVYSRFTNLVVNRTLIISDSLLDLSSYEIVYPDLIPDANNVHTFSAVRYSTAHPTGYLLFTDPDTSNVFTVSVFQSDGTQTLAGLFVFSSGDTSTIDIHPDTAVITILQNSINTHIEFIAACTGVIDNYINIIANLLPDVGDVDIGLINGLPIEPKPVS